MRLGDGEAVTFSPDGKWVLALTMASPAQLVLLPSGAGDAQQITHDDFITTGRAGCPTARVSFSPPRAKATAPKSTCRNRSPIPRTLSLPREWTPWRSPSLPTAPRLRVSGRMGSPISIRWLEDSPKRFLAFKLGSSRSNGPRMANHSMSIVPASFLLRSQTSTLRRASARSGEVWHQQIPPA